MGWAKTGMWAGVVVGGYCCLACGVGMVDNCRWQHRANQRRAAGQAAAAAGGEEGEDEVPVERSARAIVEVPGTPVGGHATGTSA